MPVPHRFRDDGSGIQKRKRLKRHWIPDQVRNDKTAKYLHLPIVTQPRKRESRKINVSWTPAFAGVTNRTDSMP